MTLVITFFSKILLQLLPQLGAEAAIKYSVRFIIKVKENDVLLKNLAKQLLDIEDFPSSNYIETHLKQALKCKKFKHIVKDLINNREHTRDKILHAIRDSYPEFFSNQDRLIDYILAVFLQQYLRKFPLNQAIRNATTHHEFNRVELNYKQPPYHIKRKLTSYRESLQMYNWNNFHLIDLITKEKRIVIIGEAGSGKTHELEYLANEVNIPFGFYPNLIRLRDITDIKIDTIIKDPYWISAPDTRKILLLDGYDELSPEKRDDFTIEIEKYAQDHPDIIIVISTRPNMYVVSDNEAYSGSIQGFKVYTIQRLFFSDIREICKKRLSEEKTERFYEELSLKGLLDLCTLPFYTVSIIDYYNENGYLPDNKNILYAAIIDKKFKYDVEHYRKHEKIKYKNDIIQALQKISICMELNRVNNLKESNMKALLTPKELGLLNYFGGISKKLHETTEYWEFEHANLNEYFAAQALCNLPFNRLIEIISFKNKILVPQMHNTISFLVDAYSDESLREWLLENCPEIIIYSDKSRIDPKTRLNIVITIIEKCNASYRKLFTINLRVRNLVNFAEKSELLKYLINKYRFDLPEITRANYMIALAETEVDENNKEYIKQILINEIEKGLTLRALLTLLDLEKILSKSDVHNIIHKIKHYVDDDIKRYSYQLITEHDAADEEIEYLLNGLEHAGDSSLINVRSDLLSALNTVKTLDNIKLLLDAIQKPNNLQHYYLEDTYKELTTTLINIYRTNSEAFDVALISYKFAYRFYFNSDKINDVLKFFEETGTDKRLFESFDDMEKHWLKISRCFSVIGTKETADLIVSSYKNGKIPFHYMELIYRRVSKDKLYLLENSLSRNSDFLHKYREPVYPDYQKREYDMTISFLYNKAEIGKIIKTIFTEIGRNSMSRDEFLEEYSTRDYYSNYITRIIGRNDTVSLEDSIAQLNAIDIDAFSSREVLHLLSEKKELPDDIKAQAIKWAEKAISKTDFNITKNENEFIFNELDRLIFKLFICLDLSADSEAKYIQMIKGLCFFDYSNRKDNICFFESKLGKQRLLAIMQMLLESESVVHGFTLLEYAEYFAKNHYKAASETLLKQLLSRVWDEYTNDSLLHTILTLQNGDCELVFSAYNKLPSYKNEILGYLAKNRYCPIISILEDEISENNMHAACYSCFFNMKSGLLTIIANYRENGKQPCSNEIFKNISEISSIELIPELLELLQLSQVRHKNTDYSVFIGKPEIIKQALTNISKQTEESLEEVSERLAIFFDAQSIKEDWAWVMPFIDNITREFYSNYNKPISCVDVVSEIFQQ